jgi:glyoxylate reductase
MGDILTTAASRDRYGRYAASVTFTTLAGVAGVYVARTLPGAPEARLSAAGHDVGVWRGAGEVPRAVLLDAAAAADGLLVTLAERIDAELLDRAPRLRAVANYAVGVDNIDLAACAARGVAVGNTPDVLTAATADLAFALILAAARGLPQAMATVREGRWLGWEPQEHLGLELEGALLGIVGLGRIGRAVGRRAEGFGMRVMHSGRDGGIALDELLARADVISLHCPLTPQTTGLIDARALALMKPTAILVNTARGPIVDQVALRDALREGRIAAAALDVTDPEPLPPTDPLLDAPNLIVLPHIGSATTRARERMGELAADNLVAALAGEPMPHAVAPPHQ